MSDSNSGNILTTVLLAGASPPTPPAPVQKITQTVTHAAYTGIMALVHDHPKTALIAAVSLGLVLGLIL